MRLKFILKFYFVESLKQAVGNEAEVYPEVLFCRVLEAGHRQ